MTTLAAVLVGYFAIAAIGLLVCVYAAAYFEPSSPRLGPGRSSPLCPERAGSDGPKSVDGMVCGLSRNTHARVGRLSSSIATMQSPNTRASRPCKPDDFISPVAPARRL